MFETNFVVTMLRSFTHVRYNDTAKFRSTWICLIDRSSNQHNFFDDKLYCI